MSILHVNQIAKRIKELFETYIDASDIPQTDKERETKILTRCLSAYAVMVVVDCSAQEAALAVTDGSDDNGLDAIFFSPAQKQMVIVQSKWIGTGIGEPDSGEISKFCRGVKDLFELSFDRFNKKIRDKQTAIEQALGDYEVRYTLVLADTGDRGLATHGRRQIDDLVKEMNDAGDGVNEPLVSFHRYGQAKLHSSLAESISGQPIDIDIGLSQWGKLTEPQPAFFGLVSGEEMADWWSKHGRRLFDRNIRQVLGSTEVNDEIRATISSNPEKFWYFNNGITIVAQKIEKSMSGGSTRDHGTFRLTGVQIVNGAQTVSAIGRYAETTSTGLDKVWISARLIMLSGAEAEFGSQVTRGTNRQNRIENRDFVSQDPEQIRLKTELAIEGIEYNIVRSDSFKPSSKAFDLHEATIALACSTSDAGDAVQAKREIGKIYEDLNKGLYKKLFNPSTNSAAMYRLVQITRLIDEHIAQRISHLAKKSGRDYGMLVHGNRVLTLVVMRNLKLADAVKSPNFAIDPLTISNSVDEATVALLTYMNENFRDSMLGNVFKNINSCRRIVASI